VNGPQSLREYSLDRTSMGVLARECAPDNLRVLAVHLVAEIRTYVTCVARIRCAGLRV